MVKVKDKYQRYFKTYTCVRSEFQSHFFVAECPSSHLTEIRVWFAESDLKIGSVSLLSQRSAVGKTGRRAFSLQFSATFQPGTAR